ncbi:MAG: haloacid dehalogenase [Chloroflexota bacterium]
MPAGANLESVVEGIRAYLSELDGAREKCLVLSREIVRLSSTAIRAMHRRDDAQAGQLLEQVRQKLDGLREVLRARPELGYTGSVVSAEKEFAEAAITRAIVGGKDLPSAEALGISYQAYLNGLGECVGELRRYILDNLRRNDFSRCEELLSVMDDIYGLLMGLDFPDAVTFGLRHTSDNVRGILERTRGDLTMALIQHNLKERLSR